MNEKTDVLEQAIILLEDNPDITDDGNLFTGKEVLEGLIEIWEEEKK